MAGMVLLDHMLIQQGREAMMPQGAASKKDPFN